MFRARRTAAHEGRRVLSSESRTTPANVNGGWVRERGIGRVGWRGAAFLSHSDSFQPHAVRRRPPREPRWATHPSPQCRSSSRRRARMLRRTYSTTGSSSSASTASTNASRRSVREPLEMGAERDGAEVLARVVGLDANGGRPRPDVHPPQAAQPRLGVRRRGEVPRAGPAGERRLALAHPRGRRRELGDVALAAALRDEPAAGHERRHAAARTARRGRRSSGRSRSRGSRRRGGRARARPGPPRGPRPLRPAARAPARPSPASRRRRSLRRAGAARPARPSRARCRSRRRAPARRRAAPAGRARRGPSPRAAPTSARRRRRSSRAGASARETSRSASSAARSTSASTSAAGWRHLPSTWAATMSGSVESGRPTPTRTRWKSGAPSSRRSDLSPLCPASPPPSRTRTSPNGRSISSWITTRRSRSSLNEPRAGPIERPDSFMYVCGRRIATRGPPGPVRPSLSSPPNFFFGFGRSQRSASASATRKPTLCGLAA